MFLLDRTTRHFGIDTRVLLIVLLVIVRFFVLFCEVHDIRETTDKIYFVMIHCGRVAARHETNPSLSLSVRQISQIYYSNMIET